MTIEDLRNRIKPELESIFGSSMTTLILTKAKMRVSAQANGDGKDGCRTFLECLGSDDKLIGMWGSLEVKARISRWQNFIG